MAEPSSIYEIQSYPEQRTRGFKGVYLSRQEMRIRRYREPIDDYIAWRLPK